MGGTRSAGTAAAPGRARPRIASRVRNLLVAAWAAVTGIAPHVLHHVGPLAGTALVAGAGGQLLFGVVGLALTVPTLLRLRRRFGTWAAPAVALAVFAGVFSVSTFVVGPRISGLQARDEATEAVDHDEHDHTEQSPTPVRQTEATTP